MLAAAAGLLLVKRPLATSPSGLLGSTALFVERENRFFESRAWLGLGLVGIGLRPDANVQAWKICLSPKQRFTVFLLLRIPAPGPRLAFASPFCLSFSSRPGAGPWTPKPSLLHSSQDRFSLSEAWMLGLGCVLGQHPLECGCWGSIHPCIDVGPNMTKA